MYAIRSIFMISVALWVMLCSGCGASGWTEYYNVNQSDQELYVTIVGITPDASPGTFLPGDGSSPLTESVDYIGGPITIDDTITISWTTDGGSVKNEVKLKRDDLGIPSKVRGGRITFTYSADGKWNVKYAR